MRNIQEHNLQHTLQYCYDNVPFDRERFRHGVEALNEGVLTFELSCQTGEGIGPWLAWVREQVGAMTSA